MRFPSDPARERGSRGRRILQGPGQGTLAAIGSLGVPRAKRGTARSVTALSAGRRFYKGHGLGNDYLVFEEGEDWPVAETAVRSVCDRHKGVGGDGIVVVLTETVASNRPPPARGAADADAGARGGPVELRMFNPDGSEFERSGNGLRILAAFLHAEGRVKVGKPFPVRVGGEVVAMRVHGSLPGGGTDVSVDMGTVEFGPTAVGMEPADVEATFFLPDTGPLDALPVRVGNPHVVVFTDAPSQASLRVVGPYLSGHGNIPGGTNVQLATVRGPGIIDALVWERGVGRTSASGTSACAVAAAAVRTRRVPRGDVRVRMEGGDLLVTVGPRDTVTLRGPVQEVATGTLSPGFCERIRGSAEGRGKPAG